MGSVALYRAVLQYKDKRYSDAKNFELAAKELNNNPLVGRALRQAVSLIKANSEKVGWKNFIGRPCGRRKFSSK